MREGRPVSGHAGAAGAYDCHIDIETFHRYSFNGGDRQGQASEHAAADALS
jgi:hypothetical protein